MLIPCEEGSTTLTRLQKLCHPTSLVTCVLCIDETQVVYLILFIKDINQTYLGWMVLKPNQLTSHTMWWTITDIRPLVIHWLAV